MEWVLINFRVKPIERQVLRIALLAEGKTLQDFFATVVANESHARQLGPQPVAAEQAEGALTGWHVEKVARGYKPRHDILATSASLRRLAFLRAKSL
jgi:hypothetical protein